MKKDSVLFSSNSEERNTPEYLFDELNRHFKFKLDAAADDLNHKCENYFTKEDNSLIRD